MSYDMSIGEDSFNTTYNVAPMFYKHNKRSMVMRRVRYRLWCDNKKEWEKDEWYLTPSGRIIDARRQVEMKKETHFLSQFTGLFDKQGKEIYEGDIVKNSINDILEVLWCDDRCCFEMRGRYDKSHVIKQLDCDIIIDLNVEVIGNIYEHSHLLDNN